MAHSRELALRDPAASALFGQTADFGSDADYGDDIEELDADDEFGDDDDEFGDDDEYEEEADMGAVKAVKRYAIKRAAPRATVRRAPARTVIRRVAKPQVSAALAARNARIMQANRARMARVMRLDPNHGSSLKIERFRLQMSQGIAIATAEVISVTANSAVTFKPEKLVCNAPCPGFITLANIQASNINSLVGSGVVDAYDFNANALNLDMELPKLSPAHRVSITGNYTGITPVGYIAAAAFTSTFTFIGHAKMVG